MAVDAGQPFRLNLTAYPSSAAIRTWTFSASCVTAFPLALGLPSLRARFFFRPSRRMHLSSRFSAVTPPGNRLSITRIWLTTCWLQSFKRGGSARFRAGTPNSLAATAIRLSASWGWWFPPTVRPSGRGQLRQWGYL